MSVIGIREQAEREVLATLLLSPSTFEELPEGFKSDAFELPDYRKLFQILDNEMRGKHRPDKFSDFLERFPEKIQLVNQITFAALPLNGRLRSKASELMNHRVPEIELNEERNPKRYEKYESKQNNEFYFELLNGKDIVMMEIPQQKYLIKNLISENSLNILMGEEKCGKSLFAMNLALSVAIGAKEWLGFEIMKHGKVLFLNNEVTAVDFYRRFKKMVERLPVAGDVSNFLVPKEIPSIDECWNTLNETCEKEKPCLIVLDCLYFAHNKDENDSSDMKALMRQLLSLRDKYGLAIVVIHHTKKGSRYQKMHNDQMRGSNVFGGSADLTIQIRRSSKDETKRIYKPLRGRELPDSELKCRLLSLNPETLWFKDEGETDEGEHIASTVQTAEEEIDFKGIFGEAKELSRKEIIERCNPTGYTERTIDRLLKEGKEKGLLIVPRYGYYAL